MPSPFLRPDSPYFGEMVADAIVQLLEDTGVTGLTSRAVAGRFRLSPSALTQRAGRAELLRLAFVFFTRRWSDWVHGDSDSGLLARLPREPEEVHGVRVWHSLAELARGEALSGNPTPHEVLALARDDERALLASRLRVLLDRPALDSEVAGTLALGVGLCLELAMVPPTMTPTAAAYILRQHARHLRADPG